MSNPQSQLIFDGLGSADGRAVNVYGLRTTDTSEMTLHRQLRREMRMGECIAAMHWLSGRAIERTTLTALRDEYIRDTGSHIMPGEMLAGALALRLQIDTSRVRAPDCEVFGTAGEAPVGYRMFKPIQKERSHAIANFDTAA